MNAATNRRNNTRTAVRVKVHPEELGSVMLPPTQVHKLDKRVIFRAMFLLDDLPTCFFHKDCLSCDDVRVAVVKWLQDHSKRVHHDHA